MTLGKIDTTMHFEVVYGRKGTGTLVAGRLVAPDSAGDWIPATASTLGKHGVYTGLTETRGGVLFYQVVVDGYVSVEMGGAVLPNEPIKSDANGKAVAASTTVATTPTQAQIQEFWKVAGRYQKLITDNEYDPSDAADTNEGVCRIGGGVVA